MLRRSLTQPPSLLQHAAVSQFPASSSNISYLVSRYPDGASPFELTLGTFVVRTYTGNFHTCLHTSRQTACCRERGWRSPVSPPCAPPAPKVVSDCCVATPCAPRTAALSCSPARVPRPLSHTDTTSFHARPPMHPPNLRSCVQAALELTPTRTQQLTVASSQITALKRQPSTRCRRSAACNATCALAISPAEPPPCLPTGY